MHKDEVKPLFIYERFEALRSSRGITKRFIAQSLGRSPELAELLSSLREREDMRMLFKLAQGASPEDVRQAVRIIEALRRHD